MYKSPIEKVYSELQMQIVQEEENTVMKAVRNVGLNVDKEELIRALQYDRNQYTKGYKDGKNDALEELRADISKIHIIGYAIVDGKREIASRAVMQIIDKCRAESEVK